MNSTDGTSILNKWKHGEMKKNDTNIWFIFIFFKLTHFVNFVQHIVYSLVQKWKLVPTFTRVQSSPALSNLKFTRKTKILEPRIHEWYFEFRIVYGMQ